MLLRQVMNVAPWGEVVLTLPAVRLRGVHGWSAVAAAIGDVYLRDIISTQVRRMGLEVALSGSQHVPDNLCHSLDVSQLSRVMRVHEDVLSAWTWTSNIGAFLRQILWIWRASGLNGSIGRRCTSS